MGPDFLFCHASMRRGLLAHVQKWGIEKKKAHRNNIIEPNLACYAEVNRESKVNAPRTFVQMMIHIAVTISVLEWCQGLAKISMIGRMADQSQAISTNSGNTDR
jgi:hypothetical protein